MAATQPGLVQLALSAPLLPGQSNPVPGVGQAVTINWTAATGTAPSTIPLIGAQTYTIDLAMMPNTGLQALWVSVDKTDVLGGSVTASVQFLFTGGHIYIPPGGGFAFAAPGIESNGVTSLQIVTTANATVHVQALG